MLYEHLTRVAAGLSDEELTVAISAEERCALCTTRTRRDLALLRLKCLRCEMDRRAGLRPTASRVTSDA